MDEEIKEITQEVKEILREICEKGFDVRNILKEKYNFYSTRSKEEILIDSNLFYFSLFEGFWKLFKIVSKNIENPLVQPWIRVIIEQSSDIFWYSQKKENEKKDIACVYWLCALGFVGGKKGDLNYDNFLNLLGDSKKKSKFLKLKKKGYPIKDIHREWHNLFTSVSEDNLPNFMEKYFLNIKGNSIKKSQIDLFFKDMSLYHHPNLIINNLEKEFIDKSHIFRCFALLSICGLALIKFSNEKRIIEELNKKVNNLFQKFGEIRGFNNRKNE